MAASPQHTPDALTLFVYGTLKEGFRNHESYCRGVAAVLPAHAWGRFYVWEPGIPILAVPRPSVLLLGSRHVADDLAAAQRLLAGRQRPLRVGARPGRHWLRIQGELLVFPDGARRLRLLDALEGFHPHTGRRAYQRVLLPVELAHPEPGTDDVRAAWTYVLPADVEPPGAPLDLTAWEPGHA